MGIQSVVLEHHSDVTVFGSHIVDHAVADTDFTFGDLFKTGDHTQGGGFSAAGGTDEDHELTVLDVQTEVTDCFNFSFVHFVHMLKKYFSHFSIP